MVGLEGVPQKTIILALRVYLGGEQVWEGIAYAGDELHPYLILFKGE